MTKIGTNAAILRHCLIVRFVGISVGELQVCRDIKLRSSERGFQGLNFQKKIKNRSITRVEFPKKKLKIVVMTIQSHFIRWVPLFYNYAIVSILYWTFVLKLKETFVLDPYVHNAKYTCLLHTESWLNTKPLRQIKT